MSLSQGEIRNRFALQIHQYPLVFSSPSPVPNEPFNVARNKGKGRVVGASTPSGSLGVIASVRRLPSGKPRAKWLTVCASLCSREGTLRWLRRIANLYQCSASCDPLRRHSKHSHSNRPGVPNLFCSKVWHINKKTVAHLNAYILRCIFLNKGCGCFKRWFICCVNNK